MTYIVLKAPLNSNQPTNQPMDDWLRLQVIFESRAFLYTFILFLRSTGCDVEGPNIEVGAKNRGGAQPSCAPTSF